MPRSGPGISKPGPAWMLRPARRRASAGPPRSKGAGDIGTRSKSASYFRAAQKLLVGGVNSPVRAFKGVGGTPVVVARGRGPYFWDLDGNRYIDDVLSWGPLVLGHAPQAVLTAIGRAAKKGTSYGACHELELELALAVRKAVPSMEK